LNAHIKGIQINFGVGTHADALMSPQVPHIDAYTAADSITGMIGFGDYRGGDVMIESEEGLEFIDPSVAGRIVVPRGPHRAGHPRHKHI
jgi:hypothetical protein